MPVIYKAQQSTIATREGKKLYYPRVILTGNVGTDVIAREIAEQSSLTSGDTKNVIDNLVIVIGRHLQASESVTLDGLGTFRLTLNSNGKGVEDEKDVSATQGVLKVRFQPASTRRSDGTVATRSMTTGARCVRFEKGEPVNDDDAQLPTDPDTGGSGAGDDDNDHELG